MKITNCRVNHVVNPIGYQMDSLTFSYVVKETKGCFTADQKLKIAADPEMQKIVFESKEGEKISSLGYTPDFVPEPGKRYYWTIQVTDDAGEQGASEVQFFETPKSFTCGQWITTSQGQTVHPLMRKELKVEKKVASASLRISGLGVYEAYINGRKVGEEILTPYYNDYNLWTQYQTYDVTSCLKEGTNVLGVMLGNGWYKGRFGFIDRMGELYGDTFKLIAELEIQYEDGQSEIIPTDETWVCAPGPVQESSIYDGEVYDSRKEVEKWSEEGADAAVFALVQKTEKPLGQLVPRLSLPCTINETIKPVEIIHTPAGETVIDFGQEITGWVEFECDEKEGTEIFLQFGEILQNENFYNENLRTAKEEFHYISNGKKAHVRPHFTFYGFRYMKVQGMTEVKLENFIGCVIYSQIEQIGKITTSNEKVNRLFLNALWGQKGNFLDVPTDCPQRDERMGWTGDAQIFAQTASLNMYTPAFYHKFLRDMKLEQDTYEGAVPHVIPDILGQINRILAAQGKISGNEGVDSPTASCAWADAATVIPWTVYKTYGDKKLLEAQYGNMKAWTDYIRKVDVEHCGGKYLWTHGFHFADWLALDNYHQGSSFGATDNYYLATVYYYYSSSLTAKAAKVLGKTEEAAYYEDMSKKVKAAFQEEFFTRTGRIAVPTQTAMVTALCFDLVPNGFRGRVIEELKQSFKDNNMHMVTGFVGTGYLCNTLTENGMNDIAYTLLLNEDFPSWLYEVNMGATTVWERWNSVLPNGMISDTGMNSLNHYSYGAIVEWMYRNMCGLNALEEAPGYEKFVVSPHPDDRFEFADMSYESAKGLIRSSWKKAEEGMNYMVEVPFDTQAVFKLPEKVQKAVVNGEICEKLASEGQLALTKGIYTIQVC